MLQEKKGHGKMSFISDRPNGSLRFGSSAELGGSARFGRTTEPSVFTEP